MTTTYPILKAGWEFAATTPNDGYRLEFKPFFTNQFSVNSHMIMDRLFKHRVKFSLNPYTVNLFFSFLFGETGQLCLGFGWES